MKKQKYFKQRSIPVVCKKKDYAKLRMGEANANVAIIDPADLSMWQARGFVEYPDYPLFLGPEEGETLVLGMPRTLRSVGTARLKGSQVVEVSANRGSYGMGSPGFFGLCLQMPQEDDLRWLVMAKGVATFYIMLDGRFLAYPRNRVHGYPVWEFEKVQEVLQDARIERVQLDTNDLKIDFLSPAGQKHMLHAVRKCGGPVDAASLKYAFRRGCMADIWLLTHDGTDLET